jgi:hypothetical protein
LVPANAREFIELASIGKGEESYLDVTKNRELVSFLNQSISPL